MIKFIDAKGNSVHFLYEPDSFPEKVKHVLVICKYENKWLLTNHKKRGLEFPGGKVEEGECLEEAGIREVFEETGAFVKQLIPIGVYKVNDPEEPIIKKVFFGIIDRIEESDDYLETFGPILVEEDLLLKVRYESHYSFIMQDSILELCVEKINEKSRGCHPI